MRRTHSSELTQVRRRHPPKPALHPLHIKSKGETGSAPSGTEGPASAPTTSGLPLQSGMASLPRRERSVHLPVSSMDGGKQAGSPSVRNSRGNNSHLPVVPRPPQRQELKISGSDQSGQSVEFRAKPRSKRLYSSVVTSPEPPISSVTNELVLMPPNATPLAE